METLNLTNDTNIGDLLNAVASGALITFENKALNPWQKEVVDEVVLNTRDDDQELTLGELNQQFFNVRKIDGVFVINDGDGTWVSFEEAMNPESWWDENFSEFYIDDHDYLVDGYYTKAELEDSDIIMREELVSGQQAGAD